MYLKELEPFYSLGVKNTSEIYMLSFGDMHAIAVVIFNSECITLHLKMHCKKF